jgi:hypothetical protein
MIGVWTPWWSRWRNAFGPACALSLLCLVAGADEGKPVREKIQISGTGADTVLPSSRPKEDPVSKPFEFLDRGNSVSGVVAPGLAPSANPGSMRNSRLMEQFEQRLDQKRNWIFSQPADFGRTPTTEEAFNIGVFGGTETKPKTALEKFLAGSGPKPERGHVKQAGSDGDKNSLDKPGIGFDRDDRPREEFPTALTNPYDSSRIISAGFSIPNDFLGISTGPARFNDFLNTPSADPVVKARDDRKHTDEFRKLLNFSGPANPLTTGLDAIHFGPDATHSELNPVTAPRLGELPGTGPDALNPLRPVNGPPGSRFNGLDNQTTKILGPSSLAPAVSVPLDRPTRQPTPTVSEFPQRKF